MTDETAADHGPLGRSVARIHAPSGRAVGAGFLVAPGLVATCAHVVTAALGGDPERDKVPAGAVRVEFPLTGADPVTARVATWAPIRADGSGDVAVLRLAAPVSGAVPPLRRVEQPWGHEFRVLGFPPRMTDGVWASGELRDRQGTGWVQLHGAAGGQPVGAGFSGAPVWDARARAVIGMTVAADADRSVSTAYVIPIERVLGGDPGLLPNPYRGLAPFEEDHAEFFHGRDEDIARLRDAIGRRPVVAVLGDSGVGKSSLVRAGLVPELLAAGARVARLRPTPGVPSRFALAIALSGLLRPDARGPELLGLAETLVNRFAGDPGPWLAGQLGAQAPLLFLDQFEELVAEDLSDARDLLGVVVRLATGTPLRVVLTLRWAAVGDLLSEDTADVLDGAVVPVAPMGRAQLRAAITRPAERAPGLYFEPGLVDRILDDAGAEPGQLPLVESLLAQLWERQDGGYVTNAAYEWLGGVHGAVARGAERALAEFVGPGEPELLRQLFTMLVRPDEAGFSRRGVPVAQLSPGVARLAQRLSADRLVVIGAGADGAAVVELAHQALIDHWPRLRGWLDADLDFLRWRARLDQQLAHARTSRRPADVVLRGAELTEARRWLTDRGDEVAPDQRTFVRNSRRRRDRRVVASLAAAVVAIAATVAATVFVMDRPAERPTAGAGAGQTSVTSARSTPLAPSGTVTTPSAGATLTGPATGPSGPSTGTNAQPPPVTDTPASPPANCPAEKICFYEQANYQGEPRPYEIDHATGSHCRSLAFTVRSVFNNDNENQYIYLDRACGAVPDLVPLGEGRPDIEAGSYKHT
jgi:hypothetical protein